MMFYDLMASHYDAVTGDSSPEAAFIHDIIGRRHHEAATLLDVGCGTGAITALLADTYQVSGLDISPAMLAVAREKLPAGTPLYLADMSCFSLDVKFDAIICAYQCVNHLLGFSAWKSFFDCVHWHLNDGGVFVFDIATIGNLIMMASGPKIVQDFGDNYLLIRVRTSDEVVFEWNIEVFELQRDGRYKLITGSVKTRSFPLDTVREALRQRFTGIEAFGSDGNAVTDDKQDRIWFACIKPLRPLRQIPPAGPGAVRRDNEERIPHGEPRQCVAPARQP
jgi:SAM-dependent methyltransferase